MEKFNPNNPEYESINDLPAEQRENYVDLPDGGFTDKSAWEAEQQRQELAKQRNTARPLLKKILFQDKTSSIDIAHEEALKENADRVKQPSEYQQLPAALAQNAIKHEQNIGEELSNAEKSKEWVTVEGSPREIIELLQKDLVRRATEIGLRVDFTTTEGFTDWNQADNRIGGYFNVRKAFHKIFINGLKKGTTIEDLEECDFRLSKLPKSYLKDEYELTPEAFELAPFLRPRYQKDGLPDKYSLKFVMFIKKPKDFAFSQGSLRFIDIKPVPYSGTKAKARVKADSREIKRFSREQWAKAKRRGLWRADNRNKEDNFWE